MGWFNKVNDPPAPPLVMPQMHQPEYTIDTVREHLEAIGLSRLLVRHADMKVLLTRIAWSGEDYLLARSPKGQPSGAEIVTFCKRLETVRRIVGEFDKIERSSDEHPDAQLHLAQGLEAVKGFVAKLVTPLQTPGGSANLTGYAVDTQILSL